MASLKPSNDIIIGAKYVWKLPGSTTQAVLDLARCYNLSIPIMQTLVTRGLTEKKTLTPFSLVHLSEMSLILDY